MSESNPFEFTNDTKTKKKNLQADDGVGANLAPSPLTLQKSVSRVTNMTVGDVRQCFQQMRNTPDLTSSTVLWCGVTAGQFALAYLLQTANSSSRRRRNKPNSLGLSLGLNVSPPQLPSQTVERVEP